MQKKEENLLDKIVSLAKRRGFVFQGSEIYGGLAGTYDYGPYGVKLKNNIKNLWWKLFVEDREDMFGVDAAILMNPKVWEASGHVSGFSDPLVECGDCHSRFRNDHVLSAKHRAISSGLPSPDKLLPEDRKMLICPQTKKEHRFGPVRQFNMMFKTHAGAAEDESSITYLRPETAGGIFANYKNVVDSLHPKLPFGIGQIGKAFRNEIAPRDFLFRAREFDQLEVEYFIRPEAWETAFEEWRVAMHAFADALGLPQNMVHELDVPKEELAHYSKRTIDFEFDYPFGRKELWGLAYRTDFDLSAHAKHSNVDLTYLDEETKERFTPHVIEPSLGVGRTVLAVLASAYTEDEVEGETRVFLKLKPSIAPVKAAVFPLLKNKPQLVEKAREVYSAIKKEIPQIMWDDNGNIGKRYRRQDEIGTPYCVTVDFDSLEKGDVTVRDRDTMEQVRVPITDLSAYLKEKVS